MLLLQQQYTLHAGHSIVNPEYWYQTNREPCSDTQPWICTTVIKGSRFFKNIIKLKPVTQNPTNVASKAVTQLSAAAMLVTTVPSCCLCANINKVARGDSLSCCHTRRKLLLAHPAVSCQLLLPENDSRAGHCTVGNDPAPSAPLDLGMWDPYLQQCAESSHIVPLQARLWLANVNECWLLIGQLTIQKLFLQEWMLWENETHPYISNLTILVYHSPHQSYYLRTVEPKDLNVF